METVNTIITRSKIMLMGTYCSECPSLLISETVNLQMNSYEVPPPWEGNVPQFLQLGLKKQNYFPKYTQGNVL